MTSTIELKAVTTIEDFIPTTEPHVFYEVWRTSYESGDAFATWRYDMEMGAMLLVSNEPTAAEATRAAEHDAAIRGIDL